MVGSLGQELMYSGNVGRLSDNDLFREVSGVERRDIGRQVHEGKFFGNVCKGIRVVREGRVEQVLAITISVLTAFLLQLYSHISTRSHQRSFKLDNILSQRLDLLGKLFLINLFAALLAKVDIVGPVKMFLHMGRVREFGKNVRHDPGIEVEYGLLLVVFLSCRCWRNEIPRNMHQPTLEGSPPEVWYMNSSCT